MNAKYARHLSVLGEEGQKKLSNATVYISRVGGVGGTAANYLARSGVGRLLLAHGGTLDAEYLNRWHLAHESDVGRPCVDVFKEEIARINSSVEVEVLGEHAKSIDDIKAFANEADVIIDAAPMFEERYNNNMLSQMLNIPMISGSMYAQEGYVMSFVPGETPCLSCLYPEKPEFWVDRHVFPALGTGPGIIGCLLANEAISYIAKGELQLKGKMLHYDLTDMDFNKLKIEKDHQCKVCSA